MTCKTWQPMLALATLSACFGPAPLETKVVGMTPYILRQGRTTQVAINGNFYVAPDIDFGTGHAATVDDTFTAMLDTVSLQNVTYKNNATLEATVPATLSSGMHTLKVNAPDGSVVMVEHAALVF